MDLFEQDPGFNCLPYYGEVNYFGEIIGATEATHYFDRLLKTIEWKNDFCKAGGEPVVFPGQPNR